MTDDSECLKQYVRKKSQAAFDDLVKRHINVVYAGALRRVGGNAHLAEDVTQRVFTALATNAPNLMDHPALVGWLHVTTRNVAAQAVRTERRRAAREQEAHAMNKPAESEATPDWDRLRPVIDETLDELDERDRAAVILRYFEGRSLAEVGAALAVSENAARMRVDRALDRMQGLLARRGVTSAVAALGVALSGHAQMAAPASLAATVSASALSAAAAGTAEISILSLMSTSKFLTVIAGAVAAAGVGIAWNERQETVRVRSELAEFQSDLRTTRAKLRATQALLDAAQASARAAESDTDALLAAISKNPPVPPGALPPEGPITHDQVQNRYRKAQEMARAGNWEAALPELLWCYDEGMVRVAGFGGVRLSFLVSELARLGAKYPPALAALRERRDRAEQVMQSGTNERGAAMELAALNAALGDEARTLQLFDQLPPGDPRRVGLGTRVYDQLLAARRYRDAAEGRPVGQMITLFEAMTAERALPANTPNPEALRRMARSSTVTMMARNIEVLAGAGQLDNARLLANKVLAYDNTPETRAIIQQHATRAGQPALLESASSP